MSKEFKGSIQTRLIKLILITLSLSLIGGYLAFIVWHIENQHKKNIDFEHTISKMVGQDVAKIVFLNDLSTATDLKSKLKFFTSLKSLTLYKTDTMPLFQYSKNGSLDSENFDISRLGKTFVDGDEFDVYTKIFYKKEFIAYGKYKFIIKTIKEIFFENFLFFILLLISLSSVSYIITKRYALKFTTPILNLVAFLEKIDSDKSIKDRIYTKEQNEYGKLYKEINTMLDRMEEFYHGIKIASVAFEIQNPMMIVGSNYKILHVNEAFIKLTEYNMDEVIGKNPSILKSGRHDNDFYKRMYHSLNKENFYFEEIINRKKDGSFFVAKLTIQTVLDENEKITYYVSSLVDITKRKETQEKLMFLEHYDKLTGLINRDYFKFKLQNYIDKNRENIYVCIALNIKNFKFINEAYSFEFANKVLHILAKRLQNRFKDAKEIARVGADEFVLLFEFSHEDIDGMDLKIRTISQNIFNTIVNDSFDIDKKSLSISIYEGISISDSLQDAESLIKESTSAVNISKESNIAISFYDKEYQKKSLAHVDLYSKMLIAIKEEQFELFYQLQNDEFGKVIGAEALLRWIDPSRGVIAPFEFIDMLENSDLILKLSPWITENACKQLAKWQEDEKTKNLTISINVSSKEFASNALVPQIRESIKKYSIKKGTLKVELLESILIESKDAVIAKMLELRELGVKISLDDFGTGYSSLSYLKELPVEQIKIDQTFVRNITTNRQDVAIVKSVILLGEAFEMSVIAEGVETKEDFQKLKELGCKTFQGYYFAKPKSIKDILI